MKGYKFFIPKSFQKNKDKESECLSTENKDNKITFQVKDPIPIDYLDKMGDKDRDLKILCESIADDFLKNEENDDKSSKQKSNERFLMSSKPYVRKNNVTSDKSLNFCWETHLRFNEYDLYITILRRSYIPPIMDMFQDIIVCSKFNFTRDLDGDGKEIQ
jgi:hypothetical protein